MNKRCMSVGSDFTARRNVLGFISGIVCMEFLHCLALRLFIEIGSDYLHWRRGAQMA
jgi:hypothetical protein